MKTKIAILRGINVGGKRKILMADLKMLMQDLGYLNIQTYIQSGNLIFEIDDKHQNKGIAEGIETAILGKFDFEVPVIVLSAEEIENAVTKNPFYKADADINKLHLTFLNELPDKDNLALVESFDYSPDQFKIIGKNAFIYCEGSYHKSKLTNDFFEKKLKVKATTRNWKTVLKLWELSK
ncbi:DUF1697 domain-containing protein [Marivirga salinae]|uniref:DUF1697 domain-containing protein n=1 Tax=Marivirga salinarum TaxID=3059078 RepID=A0AA51NB53_9BACT|nr:DUF1697 domain-containing protein [Marivirga sp. BDSF4-3]WMN12049.1 DUF1697 domain-containing protein [Marivirga sp. BDSF4-3]